MNTPAAPRCDIVCDIVLPVYNGLTFVREAIESVLECTAAVPYRLLLIDDASDPHTAAYLAAVAQAHSQCELLRQPENLGFVQACLRGEAAATAPFLCLLNSDVVVTPGWLGRLLACMESDERIASVNPLTNHAANLSVPMPAGATYPGMDALLRARYPSYPDVVTGVGFCLLLRRASLRAVGFFDPIYGRGYCEESDLCMRLTTRGWRTVVADDVYIHHHGRATFRSRREASYLANRRIFDQRWRRQYQRQLAAFNAADPLAGVRELIPQQTRFDPLPVAWRTGRALRQAVRRGRPLAAARALVAGLRALPRARRINPTAATLAAVTYPERLRVTYLVPRLVVAGGVLSVIQLVNRLVRHGVEARIATLFEDPQLHDWTRLYSRPAVFANATALMREAPPSDIVVATHWTTASWARALLNASRAHVGAYFLQDYEPWFFPASDPAARATVRETFAWLPHRIVKSDWLAGMLAADGYTTRKIRLGLDLDSFYPRVTEPHPPTLLAMARPGTPYRGFVNMRDALTRVQAQRPEIRIRLFGDALLHRQRIPFAFDDLGLIMDQEHLAQTYSAADLFIDGSQFQGFGRCGLEAMACGTACVLTSEGGVAEYARHDDNALLVPPEDPAALAEAILTLLDDPARRARLAAAGRRTAEAFCHRREARETLEYFRELLAAAPVVSTQNKV